MEVKLRLATPSLHRTHPPNITFAHISPNVQFIVTIGKPGHRPYVTTQCSRNKTLTSSIETYAILSRSYIAALKHNVNRHKYDLRTPADTEHMPDKFILGRLLTSSAD